MYLPGLGRRVIRVAFALYLTGLVLWLTLGLVPLHVAHPDLADAMADDTTAMQTGIQYLFSLLNLTLGVLLFWRRPDERVPRLLVFALLGTAATFNLPSHRVFHIIGSPWPVALIHFSFHIVSGVAYLWAVVLFPDGAFPGRARPQPSVLRVLVLGTTAVVAFVSWRGSFLDHPQFFLVFFGIAVALVGVGAQALRILDPLTTERDRSAARLLCAALLPALGVACLWVGALVAGERAGSGGPVAAVQTTVESLFPVVFAVVPVVLFASVVRYRLWDIDRLLSRVLVYGLLAFVLTAAYVGAVVASGWVPGGGLWFTVVALAAAAVLVEPLRSLGRGWANRVVFGQVLSPTEAMRQLAGSLDHLSPAAELQHVTDVTVAATRAASAGLWLLDGDRLFPAAATPRRPGDSRDSRPLPGDPSEVALAFAVGADRAWPVRHQGELLGLLCASAPPGDRLAAADDAVGTDIAAHAGLLAHNASLTVTLARQVADLTARARELHASRQRVVAAQDAERRTLERSLHDGAQQALVAAIIAARVGASAAGEADSDGASRERAALRHLLHLAERDTDELSSDGRPAVLHRLGLAGALEKAARLAERAAPDRLVVRVEVDEPLGRRQSLSPEVEAALYFACVEGLQNVTKYASATAAAVVVRSLDGAVSCTVTDDGLGFRDGPELDDAGGLAHLSRRFAALGGRLTAVALPHGGVALTGTLPVVATGRLVPS